VRGAQGYDATYGGKGGYADGYTNFQAGDVLTICVGGQPATTNVGGFNGGGNAYRGG
jgi:hypothetical protein